MCIKKPLAVLLSLLLALAPLLALAEPYPERTLPIEDLPYFGEWWTMEALNLSFCLPFGYVNFHESEAEESDGMSIVMGLEDESEVLAIDIIAADLTTSSYETLAESLRQNRLINVEIVRINGLTFITFGTESDEALGALLPSPEGALSLWFSMPGEGRTDRFLWILSTMTIGDPPDLLDVY